MEERTALVNKVKGLLAEYGIVMAQAVSTVRKKFPKILSSENNQLTSFCKRDF